MYTLNHRFIEVNQLRKKQILPTKKRSIIGTEIKKNPYCKMIKSPKTLNKLLKKMSLIVLW